MAISSIASALTQYNANLLWHASKASAELALEAIRYLIANRATQMADQGTTINYESLAAEALKLESFLGAATPRAFGRSRQVGAAFAGCGGIQ